MSDVKKGITKCRMITGTYMLQTSKSKFGRSTVSSICNCCGLDDDDFPHMVLGCPALINQRKVFRPTLKRLGFHIVGINQ